MVMQQDKSGPIATSAGGDYSTGLTIANNIFYQCSSKETYTIWSPAGLSRSGWSIKNNMIYGYNTTMFVSGQDDEASAKAAMDGNNYGYHDCEHTAVNPSLVSAALGSTPYDFSLQSNSPAINAGINLGLTTDLLKNAIVGVPDIGVIEYIQGQAQETPAQAVYYNTQKSATATKSDCGTGYTGSTVTYTVAAKKYSSTVSQADADSKAATDLSTNKQAYANANGTCTAITVYYNAQASATATKNNCGTG